MYCIDSLQYLRRFSFQNVASIPLSIEVPIFVITLLSLLIIAMLVLQELRLKNQHNIALEVKKIDRNISTTNTTKIVLQQHLLTSQNSQNINLISISKPKPSIYRIKELRHEKYSLEYSIRGQVWLKRTTWNLPNAPHSETLLSRQPLDGIESVTVS